MKATLKRCKDCKHYYSIWKSKLFISLIGVVVLLGSLSIFIFAIDKFAFSVWLVVWAYISVMFIGYQIRFNNARCKRTAKENEVQDKYYLGKEVINVKDMSKCKYERHYDYGDHCGKDAKHFEAKKKRGKK